MNLYGSKNTIVRLSSINSDVFDRLKVRKILGTPDFGPLSSFPNSMSMKLLIWNCKRAGNKVFKRTMKELVQTHKPFILVLMETKVELSSMGQFFNKMGFTASSHVDPMGHNGGIWVLWDPFRVMVKALEVNTQFIHAKVQRDNFED
ncbi:hypothetical protein LOK49_LG10G00683 [Camellia lanceoleosa]|uniref:Uncharacterized protein n=1 Tax=Camellia lanceoleosa TaxID=1840588 RepID=A0ACC0GBB7_9ERIC|nr:hypothetical protein LOK49_LG10G00683 [Camellia lanceoleosa]